MDQVMDQVEALAHKPKMIVASGSAYARFRAIRDAVGAYATLSHLLMGTSFGSLFP